MKSIALFFCIMLVLVCSSCRRTVDKGSTTIHFTYADFKEERQLSNPQELTMDSLLYPASFYLLRDTLIVVNNQPMCEYLMEIYSLNHLDKPLLQIAPKGSGPNDLASCTCSIHNNESDEFYVESPSTNTYYRTDIGVILQNKKFVPTDKFQYASLSHNLSDICVLDDSFYVAYNIWYVDDPAFSNGVKAPLQRYAKSELPKDEGLMENFVGPVNGARIFYDQRRHEIWAMDLHKDRISIYNDSLQLLKEMIGPDNLQPQYTQVKSNAPFAFISFTGDRSYMGYLNYCLTQEHVYLIYSGETHYSPEALQPVDVFKLKYDGTLECVYHLDKHLLTISVDSKEEYLYGTARDALDGYSVFVRYKL